MDSQDVLKEAEKLFFATFMHKRNYGTFISKSADSRLTDSPGHGILKLLSAALLEICTDQYLVGLFLNSDRNLRWC